MAYTYEGDKAEVDAIFAAAEAGDRKGFYHLAMYVGSDWYSGHALGDSIERVRAAAYACFNRKWGRRANGEPR